MDEHKNKELWDKCPIAGSNLCERIGTKGCFSCFIRTLKTDAQKEDAKERWEETLALVPRNIDDLHESDDCQFCKGEIHKKDGYACVEMANPEPYAEKGMFFGFGKKIRTPVGSLLMIQASICKKCRKAFRIIDMMQVIVLIASIAVGIVIMSVTSLGDMLGQISPVVPLLILIAFGVAGYFTGDLISVSYAKKVVKTIKVDMSEIPAINYMLHRDWFFFQMTKDRPRFTFSKHKTQPRLFAKEEEKAIEKEEDKDDFDPLDNINI